MTASSGSRCSRSPAYAADTWEDKLAVAQDRFIPRQDQGERLFRFWINGGGLEERLESVGREAAARNEKPYILPYCPPGKGKAAKPGLLLEGDAVELSAFKKSEDGRDLVVRLFEPTGKPRQATLRLPAFGVRKRVRLGGFEAKTLRFSPRTKTWSETDLVERRPGGR